MMEKRKTLLVAGASAIVLLAVITALTGSQFQGTGRQWLSWSPAERNAYVYGFIDGHVKGSHSACDAADDLFELGQPHRLGDDPGARCLARLETYSRYGVGKSAIDVSAYTRVLTEFYTKHREYRDIPYIYLFEFLSDSKYRSADQLYQMALNGELRTNF